jgi:3-oxoacyl-[acyl-carrier-protein] synthase-1
MGIISPIGNTLDEVTASLKAGRSGIRTEPTYIEHGFRSQIAGIPDIDLAANIDKRQLRFMGPTAAYAYLAMEQAIADSGLEESDVSNVRTGLIAGSGGPSTINLFKAHQIVLEKGAPKRMGPFMVTRGMSSTISAPVDFSASILWAGSAISSMMPTTVTCQCSVSATVSRHSCPRGCCPAKVTTVRC